jgi:hypothetical protein
VLRHNRRDLDGMARILVAVSARAEALLGGPETAAVPWQEAWSLALVAERRRDVDLAAAWARSLASDATTPDLSLPAVIDAVRLLKRRAAWPQVAALLATGLNRWPDDPRLHYEAAVFYEHRIKDLERALDHATALGEPRRLARLRARSLREQS